jgi:glutaredoxin
MAQREPVEIFGKEGCPYTTAARREYAERGVPVRYFDVKQDPAAMARMLDLAGGERRVPVIVDRGRVAVGHGGS